MTLARNASTKPGKGHFAEARAREQISDAIQNGKAARTVADHAVDAQDCKDLLAMLGLKATDGM